MPYSWSVYRDRSRKSNSHQLLARGQKREIQPCGHVSIVRVQKKNVQQV